MTVLEKGISGSVLKWIAIVTMLVDHVGVVVITRMLLYFPYMQNVQATNENYAALYQLLQGMRTIGRLAFPIFCFLLVEGFQRTKSKKKYLLRMFLFALITEVPFDLAFAGKFIYWGYQNVMVTLLIGMLVMWGCDWVEQHFSEKKPLLICGWGMCCGLGMLLAYLLQTDYNAKGILCIMALYFFRHNRTLQCMAGAISLVWEAEAMFSFLFLYLYNGQRGRQMKYFFYLFYPLHLLVLYGICYLMKIHWIPVVS